MFLNSFNLFRAIAIIFIVAGHCYGLAGLKFDSFEAKVLQNIISGGTSLFVFISGFLFHHIFYKKYNFKCFISAKAKTVLIPYLILGLYPIALNVYSPNYDWDGFFFPQAEGYYHQYIIPVIKYYWTGRFLPAYWYIPFILITFLMAPIHIAFIKIKTKYQLLIIFLLIVVSSLMHRPVDNLYVLQSVLYFMPVYLIGIICSIHKNRLYSKWQGKDLYLLGVVIGLAILETSLGFSGNYHKPPFEFKGLDIMFFQKIIMCLFFMIFLNRFENISNKFTHILASTSFTIFFIHPYLLWQLWEVFSRSYWGNSNSWLIFFGIVSVMILLCIAIALLVKKVIPKYSRNIIGY